MMKCIAPLLFLLFSLCLNADEFQSLTDNEGRRISAKVISADEVTVTIVRDDGQRFTIPITQLSQADQDAIRKQFQPVKNTETSATTAGAPIPGQIITLEFPNLPPMADNQPSKCEIHIPSSYTADKTFPLFVWFGGGKGSFKVGGTKSLVDFDKFIVVALPYPEGRLPRIAVNEGKIDEFWEYLKPMLEEVKRTVPNISDKLRIAGGSSSGAHLTGSGISQKWKGFSDYFTAYVLHEGGYAPTKNYDAARRKPVLVIFGEKSTAYGWQKGFNESIKNSRAKLTFIGIPEDGHGLSAEGRKRIREWTAQLLQDT